MSPTVVIAPSRSVPPSVVGGAGRGGETEPSPGLDDDADRSRGVLLRPLAHPRLPVRVCLSREFRARGFDLPLEVALHGALRDTQALSNGAGRALLVPDVEPRLGAGRLRDRASRSCCGGLVEAVADDAHGDTPVDDRQFGPLSADPTPDNRMDAEVADRQREAPSGVRGCWSCRVSRLVSATALVTCCYFRCLTACRISEPQLRVAASAGL